MGRTVSLQEVLSPCTILEGVLTYSPTKRQLQWGAKNIHYRVSRHKTLPFSKEFDLTQREVWPLTPGR